MRRHGGRAWGGLTEGWAMLYVQTNGLWVVVAVTMPVGWGKQAGRRRYHLHGDREVRRRNGPHYWIPRCRKRGW